MLFSDSIPELIDHKRTKLPEWLESEWLHYDCCERKLIKESKGKCSIFILSFSDMNREDWEVEKEQH